MTLYDKNNQIIDLVNKTHEIIIKQNLVVQKQSILITISGGQDSLCLFFILLHFKKQWKWHFGILYCNHFWQSKTLQINSLIFKLSLLFVIPGYLNLPFKNIFTEQNSRSWRYEQFSRISYFFTYQNIMTGHTGTDRVETILFQLIRGTSTRGLSTLNWFRSLDKNTNNDLNLSLAFGKGKTNSFKLDKGFENSKLLQSFPDTSQIPSKPVLLINFCNNDFFKFQENFILYLKIISKTGVSYIKKDNSSNYYKISSSKPVNLLMNPTILKDFIFRNTLSKKFSLKLLSDLILFKVLEPRKLIIPFKKTGFLTRTKLIKVENINEQVILIKLKLFANNFFVKVYKLSQIKNKLVKIYFISLPLGLWQGQKLIKTNKSCFQNKRRLLSLEHKFSTIDFSKNSVCNNSYTLKYKNTFTQSEVGQKEKFRFISSQVSNKSNLFFEFSLLGQEKDKRLLGFVLESFVLKSSSSKILIKYRKFLYWNQFKKKFSNFTSTNFNSFLILKTSQTFKQAYFQKFNQQPRTTFARSKAQEVQNRSPLPSVVRDRFSQPTFMQYPNQFLIIENSIDTRKLEKLNTNIGDLQNTCTFQKWFIPELRLPIFKKIALFKKGKKPLFILRPLLFLTRFDLKRISKFWDLPIYPDQTNETLSYSRNRIRKQLLPILRFFFNSQVDKLFLQFAEISNSEQVYLEMLSTYLQDEFQNKTVYNIQLNCLAINLLPLAVQRRLLKGFLNQYSIKNVKFFHIEILLNALSIKKNKFSNLQKKAGLSPSSSKGRETTFHVPFYNQFSFYTYLLTRQYKKKKLLSLFFLNKDCLEQPRTIEDCSVENTSLLPSFVQCRKQVENNRRLFSTEYQNKLRLFSLPLGQRSRGAEHKRFVSYLTVFSSKSFSNYYYKKNLQKKKQFVDDYLKMNKLKKTIYKKLKRKFRVNSHYTKATQSLSYSLNGLILRILNKKFYFFTKSLVMQYKTSFIKITFAKSVKSLEQSKGVQPFYTFSENFMLDKVQHLGCRKQVFCQKYLSIFTSAEKQNVKISPILFYCYKQVQSQTRFWRVNQLEFCKFFFYPELGTYIINNKQVLIIINLQNK